MAIYFQGNFLLISQYADGQFILSKSKRYKICQCMLNSTCHGIFFKLSKKKKDRFFIFLVLRLEQEVSSMQTDNLFCIYFIFAGGVRDIKFANAC